MRFKGIPAYRFETSDDFLYNIDAEHGNECFCIDKIANLTSRSNGCLHRGAIDLSNCQGICILKHIYLIFEFRFIYAYLYYY